MWLFKELNIANAVETPDWSLLLFPPPLYWVWITSLGAFELNGTHRTQIMYNFVHYFMQNCFASLKYLKFQLAESWCVLFPLTLCFWTFPIQQLCGIPDQGNQRCLSGDLLSIALPGCCLNCSHFLQIQRLLDL
jgi:hypothetical protein